MTDQARADLEIKLPRRVGPVLQQIAAWMAEHPNASLFAIQSYENADGIGTRLMSTTHWSVPHLQAATMQMLMSLRQALEEEDRRNHCDQCKALYRKTLMALEIMQPTQETPQIGVDRSPERLR